EPPQVLRVIRPTECGERPQARREPGVEHVLVLVPARPGWRLLVRTDADGLTVGAVPDRDAVPPPQLARDAPVVHVVDPGEVPLGEFGRLDANPSVADRVARGFGQRPGTDEPLQA